MEACSMASGQMVRSVTITSTSGCRPNRWPPLRAWRWVTGESAYWTHYDRLWAYAWTHFVDHEHGAWWRILRADNSKISDEKSPAGKVDYHTMGACYDVLEAPLRR